MNIFSKQQQEFNNAILSAIPDDILGTQMQYFITNGKEKLFNHLALLHLIFWKEMWSDYYKDRWHLKIKNKFDFIFDLKKSKDFNFLILVEKSVNLDLLYSKMLEDDILELSEHLPKEKNILPSSIFFIKKRYNEDYAFWHKNSLTKIKVTNELSNDIKKINEKFKDKTMDLFETLLWYDFVFWFNNYKSFKLDDFKKDENTRCIATLGLINGYGGVYYNEKNNRFVIYNGSYFGTHFFPAGSEFYCWDYSREIIF